MPRIYAYSAKAGAVLAALATCFLYAWATGILSIR